MNAQNGTKVTRLSLAAAAVITAGGVLATAGCAVGAGNSSASNQGQAQAVTNVSSPAAVQLPSVAATGNGNGSAPGGSAGNGNNGGGAQSGTSTLSSTPLPAATVPTVPLPLASSLLSDDKIQLPPGLLHLLLPTTPPTPGPSGTIGDPNTPCLQGYVWRQAYKGDYVCVTTANRTEAADDNAAASSRVNPAGGPYGAKTCLQGYVWRQVVTNDDVCVTPAVRAQAQADNAAAGGRIARLELWSSSYTPPGGGDTQTCSGDICSVTEGGWDGPNLQLNGDQFNDGPVLIEIKSNSGHLLWTTLLFTAKTSGYPGYTLAVQTPMANCSAPSAKSDNDYAIAVDTVSGRTSNEVPFDTNCASL